MSLMVTVRPSRVARIVVVALLDLRIQLDDLLQQGRLDLILEIRTVELVQLPGQPGLADAPGFLELLDPGEIVRVAVDLADLHLELLELLELLRLARRGRLPVHPIRPRRQRLDLRHVVADDPGHLVLPGIHAHSPAHKTNETAATIETKAFS